MSENLFDNLIVVCAAVIVEPIENKPQALLVRHGEGGEELIWKFCGGKFEKNDKGLIEAVQREALEELGIGLEIRRRHPFSVSTDTEESYPEQFIPHDYKDGPQGRTDLLIVHYWARRVGEIRKSDKIKEAKWIPLDDLWGMPKAENVVPALMHLGYSIKGLS
jgi:8-oxo-dGTP pyrophosphatase MutT (NUDIX family)